MMKTPSFPDGRRNGTARVSAPPASSEPKRHSVFLVEDHPITQAGLIAVIGREEDLVVCGQSDNAPRALDLIAKLKPAIVISDIALKTSNGLELMKNLVTLCPGVSILAMSMHDENVYAERAIRAGARGYIMKREAADKIVPAIRAILAGDYYLSETMKEKLLNGIVLNRKSKLVSFPLDTLSDRELEVFQLIGNGYTTRDIAQRLNLSTKTIDSYREHLKLKLDVEKGAELVRQAIRWTRAEDIVET